MFTLQLWYKTNLKEVSVLSTMHYIMYGILYHTRWILNSKVPHESLTIQCTKQWCEATNNTFQKWQRIQQGKGCSLSTPAQKGFFTQC